MLWLRRFFQNWILDTGYDDHGIWCTQHTDDDNDDKDDDDDGGGGDTDDDINVDDDGGADAASFGVPFLGLVP